MELIRSDVLKVSTLGPRRFPTPVRMSAEHFVDEHAADMIEQRSTDPRSIIYLSLDHPLLKLWRLPYILACLCSRWRKRSQLRWLNAARTTGRGTCSQRPISNQL